MTRAPTLDPFTVFGVDRSLELDDRDLERRYLELSRDSHPDLHRASGAADCAAVLARAAEINDSWRLLRDRWQRARAWLQIAAPTALDDHKLLDPEFLVAALELAEQVANADADAAPVLRQQLRTEVETAWKNVCDAARRGDHAAAARHLHESKYARKALADLDARLPEGTT